MITKAELDLILEYAPRLREAGVSAVSGVVFLPLEVVDDRQDVTSQPEEELSPLNDPKTFGRRTGVPTRKNGGAS